MKQNLFNTIQIMKPKRNKFDLSHEVKLSGNMGELIPIMFEDCMPGDKFQIGCQSLIKFAPLVAPIMQRINVSIHYFFVPYRILWDGWEKFITNTKDGSEVPPFPYLEFDPTNPGAINKLANYLGMPWPTPGADTSVRVSAMYWAAYQKIYADYYRDQNLIPDPTTWKLINGDNTGNLTYFTTLRKRAWEHDYFTSCLPWAQKGDAVDIPLGDVVLKDPPVLANTLIRDVSGSLQAGALSSAGGAMEAGGVGVQVDPNGTLEVEATTINTLRRAFKLQEWLEKNARAGTRYIESILAHFGVKSSDARLQRPEYITGLVSPVVINEVLNTTGTDTLPQGNMSGHAVAGVNKPRSKDYFCEEHGVIMGIMSVMPKTAYFQGVPKNHLKINDFTEYAWPEFAHLGEQEVKKVEVFAYNSGTQNDTFGYLPRYAEYKFRNSRVCGDFAKDNNLMQWHMARKFDTPQSLNEAFISCDPTQRIFAVEDPDVEKLYIQHYNEVKAIRPLPVFGTPTF